MVTSGDAISTWGAEMIKQQESIWWIEDGKNCSPGGCEVAINSIKQIQLQYVWSENTK